MLCTLLYQVRMFLLFFSSLLLNLEVRPIFVSWQGMLSATSEKTFWYGRDSWNLGSSLVFLLKKYLVWRSLFLRWSSSSIWTTSIYLYSWEDLIFETLTSRLKHSLRYTQRRNIFLRWISWTRIPSFLYPLRYLCGPIKKKSTRS